MALLSTAALLAGFSVQSATAADIAVKAPPIVAPAVHQWDGLYASFSAGGSWTNVKSSEVDNTTDTLNLTVAPNPGIPAGLLPITIPYQYSDGLSGKEMGAVFTFTMGYNVVWGSWVAGIQSEVSYNSKNEVHLSGPGNSQASLVVNVPGFPVAVTTNRNADVFARATNNWTISEMARIGYLIAPDWQVYGLIGWSWGGFDYDGYSTALTGLGLLSGGGVLGGIIGTPFTPAGRNDNASFTLGGVTYGAGIEKDFGWLRAFVQYKGISYGSHNITLPANASGAITVNLPAVVPPTVATATDSVAGSAVRSFKASVNQVTAGVTIPINWHMW